MTSPRLYVFAACFAALTLANAARADDSADIAAIMATGDKFLANAENALPQLTDQLLAQMQRSRPTTYLEIKNKGEGGLARFKEIVREEYLEVVKAQTEGLDAKIAALLTQSMTADELAQTKAFLSSPAGTKYLDVFQDSQAELQGYVERAGAITATTAADRAIARAKKDMF